MYKLIVKEIIKEIGADLASGSKNTAITDITTDSRKVVDGSLFVAVKGERFDGHDFIENAVNLGAKAVLVSKDIKLDKNISVIKVKDTIKAYGLLSGYVRNKFENPVIAVTGSVGKTGTCNMIASALKNGNKVLSPKKNFNNEIGLPNTLLKLDDSYDYAVLEMGMRGFGEIAYLSNLAKPNIGVITNIGITHIGRLKSKQNILKAKMELIEGMDDNTGVLLLNGDDGLLRGLKGLLKIRHAYFGTEEGNDYKAYNIYKNGDGMPGYNIKIKNREYDVKVNAPGYHMVYNSLVGIAVANELGLSIEDAIEGVTNFVPKKQRMEIKKINKGVLINDTYNACPESVEAGLSVLNDISKGRRKVAVLGDMLEMGEYAEYAHKKVGCACYDHGVEVLVCIGDNKKYVVDGAVKAGMNTGNTYACNNYEELKDVLNTVIKSNDATLIKGSRGMKMEKGADIITGLYQKGETKGE